MADISAKFQATLQLVENGEYFAINRPRQFGKTTLLEVLARYLNESGEWLVFNTSFEGIGSEPFESPNQFCGSFLRLLARTISMAELPEIEKILKDASMQDSSMEELSETITRLVNSTDKKLVLLIDEVDKSSNNQIFLDFLGMLRNKYLNRHKRFEATFHSVVLAGLHDIKTLKLKIRSDEESKYNSPWNIAADFDVDMSLHPHEIVPMLEDYAGERGVKMDTSAIAEALFYYTSGYPFLVSALCKLMDEKLMPLKEEKTWTVQDIETAADRLIKSERSNTNFDTLVKNLENDQALYDLTYRLVIEGETIPYSVHAPIVYKGVQHGILKNGHGIQVHNRIFNEVIANYMTVKLLSEGRTLTIETTDPYLLPGNALNVEKVLTKFQVLMREEYSKNDAEFLERNGRLIFLAFLKPIINAKGYTFKEPEISEERRMDIAITFFQHKYVVELKIWRGEEAHQRGLAQLANYLERQHLDEGFLVIFDRSGKKTWEKGWLDLPGGKRAFAVWV